MIKMLAILGVLILSWYLLSKLYENKSYMNYNLLATLTMLGLIILVPVLIAVIPFIIGIGLGLLIISILIGIVGFAIYGFILYLTRR